MSKEIVFSYQCSDCDHKFVCHYRASYEKFINDIGEETNKMIKDYEGVDQIFSSSVKLRLCSFYN